MLLTSNSSFAANVVSMDEQVKNSLQSRSSAVHSATNSKAPTHAASMPTLVSLFRHVTQPLPCATPSEYQCLSGCWMHLTTKPSCTARSSVLLCLHASCRAPVHEIAERNRLAGRKTLMITTDNPNARRPVLDSHGMADTRYNDQSNTLEPVVSTTAQCGDLPHSASALRYVCFICNAVISKIFEIAGSGSKPTQGFFSLHVQSNFVLQLNC